MADSDQSRLSVSVVDVIEGRESEFLALARTLASVMLREGYGRAEAVRDEAMPLRFYVVRHWTSATSAEECHGDKEVQAIISRLYQVSRVTHVVNGVHRVEAPTSSWRRR